ncbi:MAG TPA: AAA family ATPase [Candidatus Saccharimonadales bacterium]|nr:AAA family ATPase [Candidatus Saccharimonadales bacterium]
MNYLITGRAGSGKSAVGAELQSRGLNALDTDDIPGLANWEDLNTGKRIEIDPSGFIDYTKVGWNWNQPTLRRLLETAGQLFLCGSASNELDFHGLFDKVFVLSLDPETQKERLRTRSSKYGKDPAMQKVILQEQKEFVEQAVRLGAMAIDNTRPINVVADEILTHLDEI